MAAFCWISHIRIIAEVKALPLTHMCSVTMERSPTHVSGLYDMLEITSRTSYCGGFLLLLLLKGSVHDTSADRLFDEILRFKR